MINRVKKSVTKNGRSAGMSMAMITLEDLEGQIDGVLFAETLADITKRYPESVSPRADRVPPRQDRSPPRDAEHGGE